MAEREVAGEGDAASGLLHMHTHVAPCAVQHGVTRRRHGASF